MTVTSADFQCIFFSSGLEAARKTDSGLAAYDSRGFSSGPHRSALDVCHLQTYSIGKSRSGSHVCLL